MKLEYRKQSFLLKNFKNLYFEKQKRFLIKLFEKVQKVEKFFKKKLSLNKKKLHKQLKILKMVFIKKGQRPFYKLHKSFIKKFKKSMNFISIIFQESFCI